MSTEALNQSLESDATGADDFVDGVEHQQNQEEGKGGEQTPPVQSNDELRQALAKLTHVVTESQRPKETPAVPLTPEQEAEKWGIFNPEKKDPDFFKKWLRLNSDMPPEEQAKAVGDYKKLWDMTQHGLVRQAVVGSRNLFMEELAKRDSIIQELQGYVSERKAGEIRERFETSFPVFSDRETYSDILRIVAASLAQKPFNNESEYFKALADGAAAVIKRVKPDFELQTQPNNRSSATNRPKLPRSRVGGTGGTSGGGGGDNATVHRGKNGDDAETLDWK